LLASLVNASVGSGDAATTVAADAAGKTTLAGIGSGDELRLVSRLVLAAFSMQLDIVALSKWAGFLRVCLPHIQRHISESASGSIGSGSGGDLMRLMVLPSLHMLRLSLSQYSLYFARANGSERSRHRRTPSQLWRRLVPLFVTPATGGDSPAPALSVDMLAALLDAFGLFLALCLKNADRVPMPTPAPEERPGSRASHTSAESTGTLGAVPILRFVSGIFGQDSAAGATDGDAAREPDESPLPCVVAASDSAEDIEALGFDLVPMVAVLQEVWDAFDFGRGVRSASTSPGQELDGFLLKEFGIAENRRDDGAGAHVRRTVHGQITRILEHAAAAQPTTTTEAVAALWVSDNPQWIASLDTSVRSGASGSSRRRQSSSASSVHTALGQLAASTDSAAVVPAAAQPVEEVAWNWRAVELLERVPGQSPIAILMTLLSDLHIRSVDPAGAGAGYSSVSSGGGASATFAADARSHAHMSLVEDTALIRFVELYARHRLTARASAVLVPHIMSMLKEYNGGAQQFKFLLPFLLRMFTELCERVASNSAQAPDTARGGYSQELSAQYAQMVDNCILIAGRSFDQSTWLRRADTAGGAAGSGGGALVVRTDALLRPADGAATHLLSEDDIIDHTLAYIGDMVVPLFALLVPDYERQVTIASNLMHYAVTPAFRSHMTGGYSGPALALASKSRHFARVLRCLDALGQQAPLMKVWRREVWEFFCDAKFFPASTSPEHATMSPALAVHWRRLLRALLTSDKDKFADLLAKVSSSSAGPAIFANREHEAHMRAIALRRLSFVIWAGTVNRYLPSLPHIQEKLVEIFKSAPHPAVQMEVFLCLRVLLCRIANQHMSNFWPMLLTELMRLCLQQLDRSDRRGEEQANLFLAACKFLDLLFILGTEDFMIHQWIFITDTIDALYASRSASYALLDRLSTRLLSMPSATRRAGPGRKAGKAGDATLPSLLAAADDDDDDPTNLVFQPVPPQGLDAARAEGLEREDLEPLAASPLKRPIVRMRAVSSIRELDVFLHNASVQTYQAAITLAEPDHEFIEALLVSDLLYLDLGGAVPVPDVTADQVVFH
ncbi:hypothetical protein IWQ56_001446, partial [Coemansia nantahalensis]